MHTNSRSHVHVVVWTLALFILLIGMSCSLFSGDAGNSRVEDGQSTPPPMPTAEGTVDIDAGLTQLSSYRAHLTISFTADSSPTGQVDASVDELIEEDRAAKAFHTRAHIVADRDNPPIVEDRYEIETTRYTMTYPDMNSTSPTGCMVDQFVQTPGVVNSGFSVYVREIKKGKMLAQDEMVNGIKTDHYQVSGADFPTATENEQVSGEMWVAQAGGYLVKASGQVEADVTDLNTSKPLHGHGQWAFTLEDIDTATITPPAECLAQGNTPLPLPPDAANFSSSQGFFSYSTQLSVEEVAKFYRDALPPQGWTITERGDADGTLMWEVSRQDIKYMLSIMPSNGMTIVNAAQIK